MSVVLLLLRRSSGAQRLAATRTTRVKDLAAGLGGHACAKPVAALANQVRGLVGAFHRSVSGLCGAAPQSESRSCPEYVRGPVYSGPFSPSQTRPAPFATKTFPRCINLSQTPENRSDPITAHHPRVSPIAKALRPAHVRSGHEQEPLSPWLARSCWATASTSIRCKLIARPCWPFATPISRVSWRCSLALISSSSPSRCLARPSLR